MIEGNTSDQHWWVTSVKSINDHYDPKSSQISQWKRFFLIFRRRNVLVFNDDKDLYEE